MNIGNSTAVIGADTVLNAQLQSNLEDLNWDPEAYFNLFTPLEYF